MDNWKPWIDEIKSKKFLALGLLVLLALPVTLILVFRSQDTRSSAATPDKLEIESAVLDGKVAKLSDSAASGGQFVRLNNTASGPSPTNIPTSVPNPTISANAIYVPDSIDSTGSKNVQVELYNFIKNTPNGSTIVFKKNGIYNLGKVLQIINKRDMAIEGNGATLKLTSETASSDWWASGLYVEQGSENVTVRNFKILGDFPLGGTPEACCSREAQHGMGVYASKNILIENVDISYVGGDCITVYPDNNSVWNDGVIIRNSVCKYTGKRAISVKGSSNVLIENNFFDELGYAVIGSEPGVGSHGVTNLTIRNNTIGRYSLINSYIGALYYYSDAPWCEVPTDMQNITITGNIVEGNPNGKRGDMMGIDVRIYDHGDGLRKNVVVTNNVGKRTIDTTIKRFGTVMYFRGINGVTVTGNTQPLSAGTLVNYPDSTNVNISGNNTN